MPRRLRKLIGALVMLEFVGFYALLVMALAQSRPVQGLSTVGQAIFYAVVGVAWILPLMPLIRWMERPDT